MENKDGLIGIILMAIIGAILNILRFVFGVTAITSEKEHLGLIIYYSTTAFLVVALLFTLPFLIKWISSKVQIPKAVKKTGTRLQRQGIRIKYSTESNDSYDYYYSAYQEQLLKDCEKILEEKYKQSWFINGSKYHFRIRTGLKKNAKYKDAILVYSGKMEPIVINMV